MAHIHRNSEQILQTEFKTNSRVNPVYVGLDTIKSVQSNSRGHRLIAPETIVLHQRVDIRIKRNVKGIEQHFDFDRHEVVLLNATLTGTLIADDPSMTIMY